MLTSTNRAILLLRVAAFILAFYAFGHTYGGVYHDDHRGPRQAKLFEAMRTYTFQAQGFTRSYWMFYRGFGLFVGAALVLCAVLAWMLANLARSSAELARPFVVVLAVTMLVNTVLSWKYFFIAPGVLSTVTTGLLTIAALSLPSAA